MATSYTENYGLCQWEATDPFVRTDFNQDNAKVDAALAELESAKMEVIIGSYNGSGTSEQAISLGFTPRAVLLETSSGQRSDGTAAWGGLILPDVPLSAGVGASAKIVEGGFIAYHSDPGGCGNVAGVRYRYLAFK